jgi:type I restriction enzyme S subunit
MTKKRKTWKRQRIGSLCELVNGRVFKPTDWTEEGLPIVRIQNLNNPKAPFNRFNGDVKPRFRIDSGALLFAWSGTPGTSFGAHIWNGGPAVLNQHIFRVDFDEEVIDKRFLRLAINQKLDELIDKAHGGVGLRHVTKGRVEETEIDVPPLDEQRRIVAAVDNLFTRSQAARVELSRVPRLVERHKQAVLRAAFAGRLTRDDCSDWPVINLGDVIADIDAGKNIRCEERPPSPAERGIVKVSSVTWGTFDPLAAKTPGPEAPLDARTLIQPGDFLISRANTLELVGACVIVDNLAHKNLYLSDKVLRIRFTEPLQEWILYFLRSPEGRRQMEMLATGNQLSMRNISQAALKAIRTPLPKEEVRNRILRRVKATVTAFTDTLNEATRANALLDRLERATLTKAFQGELVVSEATSSS